MPQPQTWSRPNYQITTNKQHLSVHALNAVFAQDWIYWTQPFPDGVLQGIIDNSLCLGLYKVEDPTGTRDQIGFARLITDDITFAYLTDLYVLPEYQGLGLGGWLIDCVGEMLRSMPYLRWAMLRTSGERSKRTYEKRLGMRVLEVEGGTVTMGWKGGGGGV